MVIGAQFVLTDGMLQMQQWSVDNWDMVEVSLNLTVAEKGPLLPYEIS